ncbi:MAG: ANTAR domain-containing protein [Candidatus Thiodiazotropha endolucinida]|nr:ANTAR domain-containing protein [Candidatus Thiodiazotropha sp. (ex Lucina pensylvanica)]MCG8025470.1 ANTAR domain-containing protein [Candidatus Thiodiazotropha endolucinida]
MDNKAKLLIVDKHQSSSDAMAVTLKSLGYRIVSADDIQIAAQLNFHEKPDLVILDIRIPEHSLIELTSVLLDSGSAYVFLLQHFNDIQSKLDESQRSLGFLVNSDDHTILLSGIESALTCSRQIRYLQEEEQRCSKSLKTEKAINIVIGILMERYNLNRDSAYELLRSKARSERRRVIELAQEILDAHSIFNQLNQ